MKKCLSMALAIIMFFCLIPTTTVLAAKGESISQLDLTVTAPVDGAKPSYDKIDGRGYYSDNGIQGSSTRIFKNGIAWFKSASSYFSPGTTETFVGGTTYTVKINLLPKGNFVFETDVTAKINGNTATVETYDDGSICVSVTLTATQKEHAHTPSDWRITGAYHYKACTTCGDFLDQEDHMGGVATCAEKGKCSVCGYEYIDVNENHIPDTTKWVIRGDMYHYHACKLCGAHCDIGEHVAGPTGTSNAAVVCKDCGYIITPAIEVSEGTITSGSTTTNPTQKPADGTSNATDSATEPTDGTAEPSYSETTGTPTTDGNTDQKDNDSKDNGIVLWIILGIAVVLAAGTVVTVVVINKKKSK